MAAPRLTGATRAEHNLCTAHGVRLSPSGHALVYGARGRALPRTTAPGWVLVHHITAPAHVLRVGPAGTLADPSPPGPHDRDPHNVAIKPRRQASA